MNIYKPITKWINKQLKEIDRKAELRAKESLRGFDRKYKKAKTSAEKTKLINSLL